MTFENKMNQIILEYKDTIKSIRLNQLTSEFISNIEIVLENKVKIKHIGICSNLDLRTVEVTLFDKNNIKKVINSLLKLNLGINITSNQDKIILSSPILSEESKNEIIKNLKNISEDTRVKIRMVRQTFIKSKPELKKKIQKETDKNISIIDDILKDKINSLKG